MAEVEAEKSIPPSSPAIPIPGRLSGSLSGSLSRSLIDSSDHMDPFCDAAYPDKGSDKGQDKGLVKDPTSHHILTEPNTSGQLHSASGIRKSPTQSKPIKLVRGSGEIPYVPYESSIFRHKGFDPESPDRLSGPSSPVQVSHPKFSSPQRFY